MPWTRLDVFRAFVPRFVPPPPPRPPQFSHPGAATDVCLCYYSHLTILYSSADMRTGVVGNMVELGITESFRVKQQVLLSAAEAAEMILRVDNIIKAAPR